MRRAGLARSVLAIIPTPFPSRGRGPASGVVEGDSDLTPVPFQSHITILNAVAVHIAQIASGGCGALQQLRLRVGCGCCVWNLRAGVG